MIIFRNFSAPLWGIFGGNLLLFVASLFYLAWWWFSFRSNVSSAGAGFFIAAAMLTGMAGIVLMSGGINSLSQESKGLPVRYLLIGAVILFVILLAVTQIAFQRVVTSELMLMVVWAAVEASAIAVLQGSGRFGPGRTVLLALLVALATAVGIVCYVQHYRLEEPARFWNGLIPLATDAGVMAAFLGVLAFS